MSPRDRDTRRGRYPEPEWDEYASEAELGEYEDPTGFAGDDLPDWSGQEQPANQRRPGQPRSTSQPRQGSQPTPAPRRRSTAPLPELSRSMQREEQPLTDPRRSSTRPSQPRPQPEYVEPAEEQWSYEESWPAEEIEYSDDYYEEDDGPPRPRRRTRGGARSRGGPRPAYRAPSMPPALTAAIAAQDRSALYLLGASVVSIFLMSLMLAARVSDLPGMIPIHLDASGTPDLWGTPSTLWRIVLASVMITVINVITAWFLSPRDAFVGRFLVGSSLLAQLIAWIALFLLLW
jgi:hypothetical protein